MVRVALASVCLLAISSSLAAAEAPKERRLVVVPRPEAVEAASPAILTGHTIFVTRCIGGCAIVPGDNNAPGDPMSSPIANAPTTIAQATELTENEWALTMACVREVYSPFAVNVVDTRPPPGTSYSAIVVGGTDASPAGAALGLPPDVGGIATGGCNPDARGVSYAFADNDNVNGFTQQIHGVVNEQTRALTVCYIIAQETAHSFGLPNHQYEWLDDKSSACNDPMTYRSECGGQRFFRNRFAACGEFVGQQLPCQCGANQNSHLKLLGVLGEGTSTIPAPTASITTPNASTSANSLGSAVVVEAGSKRGVDRVELYVNGFKWAEVRGAAFGREGQPNPSSYSIPIPADLPNSIVDIQVKAYDDLNLVGESETVTVTKGPAGGCTSEDACALGQKCEAGKCFWDPPSGEIGDPCEYPQFCIGGLCSGTSDLKVCTQNCVVGLADACPNNLECISTGGNGQNGICFPYEESGCCSTSSGQTPWAPFLLAGTVFGFVIFRRRRR